LPAERQVIEAYLTAALRRNLQGRFENMTGVLGFVQTMTVYDEDPVHEEIKLTLNDINALEQQR
jgi:hypothetical protein